MSTSLHQSNALADNLRSLMQARRLNQEDLAERSGVAQSTISRIMSGAQKTLRNDSLLGLARYFGVSVEQLLTQIPETHLASRGVRETGVIPAYSVDAHTGTETPTTHATVLHLDFQISAGDGSEIPVFAETKYPMLYRIEWFQRLGVRPEHVRSMGVRGSSMERTLFDGDRIAINTTDNTPSNDRVYALILDGEAVVKRLFRHAGGVRIVSDNDDKLRYPDILVSADEMQERVQIIGRVIDKSGAGGL